MLKATLIFIGIFIAVKTIAAILWSIARPSSRLWPPIVYGFWTPVIIWAPTFALFGIIVVLGIQEWGGLRISNLIRYGIGLPLIVLANFIVWYEVGKFGIRQTGGAKGRLRTEGLYRYSRNPQYVGDSFMIIGWMILSASPSVILVGSFGIAVLLIAPFAEEPWLEETYGSKYNEYRSNVRRFF